MSECPNLATCGFFRKFSQSNELAFKGFVVLFCRGPKQGVCKRKEYREAHGCAPSDAMMPNGAMIAK
jgi:hypothetical protein